jgi:flagellar hook-basal body complex protein FliE
MSGKADIQDVVLAVSNAEVALETVVAVRDTAIKAYKEIMSMPM